MEQKAIKKWRILPKLALTGVIKNGAVYYPYLGAGIFSVFTYFVFSSILHNEIIAMLPQSAYAWMLLQIGRVLLGFILLPFLYYTNSFLIKRRKKEIGLYSILGLEKNHIGMIMLVEAVVSYGIVLAGGILGGTVLSKLLFLFLLRMTGLPIDVKFTFHSAAFAETAVFFFWVYTVNLVSNLVQVGRAKPIELLSGGKKGEKEPRFLWIYAAFGAAVLAGGYYIAVTSQIDSMIFINFFLAVFLVVAGTYFLFTSGSVAFLKLMKKRKQIYYRAENFITISGMLYRMKKNAAGLVNICIFSTMVIITLICTSSLYLGLDEITAFDYPYDVGAYFERSKLPAGDAGDDLEEKLEEIESKYNVIVTNRVNYERIALSCGKEGNSFQASFSDPAKSKDNYRVNILTLEDYNKIQGSSLVLEENEAVIFSSGADFSYDSVNFMGNEFRIAQEPEQMCIAPKSEKNVFQGEYYLVVKDKEIHDICVGSWADRNGVEDIESFVNSDYYVLRFDVEGNEEERNAGIEDFGEWCKSREGFVEYYNNLEGREKIQSMNGGLLFIGVLFSLVFMMCLLLIMYYKQISEGYEDQNSFSIMQKVGMSDKEIRSTIHRQILQVFFLPLLGAVLHTIAGLFMVNQLFATLRFFNTGLIIRCAVGVTIIFIMIYGLCYLMTAKTYYGIVKPQR